MCMEDMVITKMEGDCVCMEKDMVITKMEGDCVCVWRRTW